MNSLRRRSAIVVLAIIDVLVWSFVAHWIISQKP